jgi:predicted Fe-Mo cluster-binding NifX family protein
VRVVVSAMQESLDAEVSPVFGRCPAYVFVDSETMEFEAVPNPAMAAAGGAGIQAAQFAVSKGAQAVLTGNVGPNAFNVLQQAGISVHPVSGGTVRQVVEAFNSGQAPAVSGATSGMHGGMGGGMGRGMGGGMGRGMGRGMGGGMGRGMGAGMGAGTWNPAGAPPPAGPRPPEQDLSELTGLVQSLKQQLDQVTKRLEDLEKKK